MTIRRTGLAALAVVLFASTIAEAGIPSARRSAERQLRRLLPSGWSVERGTLEPGVLAMAVGPSGAQGRPALVISRLATPVDTDALTNADGTRALATLLSARSSALVLTDVSISRITGVPEIRAELSDGSPFSIRFFLLPDTPGYLLTVSGPTAGFNDMVRRLEKRVVPVLIERRRAAATEG